MASKQVVNGKLALEISDHISAALAYWDKDLVCGYVNAAYEEWFGKTAKQMVGKMTLRELLGPVYELNLPYINGVLEGKPQTFEREVHTLGGIRHSIANYFPKIVAGEVVGFFVHVADITPIKELEKELLQSNETIREQNKVLLNFTNIVTHNLKSYANNLAVLVQLFKSPRPGMNQSELVELLGEISAGFLSTIHHLSEVSSVRKTSEMKYEQVNLASSIERAVGTIANDVIEYHAEIRNNVSPAINLVVVPTFLDNILLNLLSNSIKFRKPGQPPIIELDAINLKSEIVCYIKDNGVGIDLDKHRDSLFRLYNTTMGSGEKGIGLFLVKQKVEAMGGYIEVESELGFGTIFKIHFKVANFR